MQAEALAQQLRDANTERLRSKLEADPKNPQTGLMVGRTPEYLGKKIGGTPPAS